MMRKSLKRDHQRIRGFGTNLVQTDTKKRGLFYLFIEEIKITFCGIGENSYK